jgi:hypothetical protein
MIAAGFKGTVRSMINAIAIPPWAGTSRGGTPAGSQNTAAEGNPATASGKAKSKAKVTIRGQRSDVTSMLRYWRDLGPRARDMNVRLRGEGDDPLGRDPLLERWETDEEFRTSVSTRKYPSVNRETIDMWLAGDLGC